MAELDALLSDMKTNGGTRAGELLDATPELLNAKASDGTSLLQQASYLRADAAIQAFRARGAHVDLFTAAALGDLDAIEKNLTSGTPVSATSADGFTALHLAAHFGHMKAAERLQKSGADLNARSTNGLANYPLHAAAAGGQTEMVDELLAWGARADTRDRLGHTPLHIAAAAGSLRMVEALLTRGAELDARSDAGKTPHDIALEQEHADVAARLTTDS